MHCSHLISNQYGNLLREIAASTEGFSYSALQSLCWAASLNPLKQNMLIDGSSSLPEDYASSPPVTHRDFTMPFDTMDPGIKPETLERLEKFMADAGISPLTSTIPCTNPPPDFETALAAYNQPRSSNEKRVHAEDARLAALYEQHLAAGSTTSSSSKSLRKEHKAYLRHTGRSLFIVGQSPFQNSEDEH
jgi:hypothetical protein